MNRGAMPFPPGFFFAAETEPLTLPRMTHSALIIVRRGENRAQCTIRPLRGTPGLDFLLYPLRQKPDLSRHLLLAPDAPPLTRADAGRPLLLLDANWRHAPRMRKAIEPVEARSIPPGWRTAYPRRSRSTATRRPAWPPSKPSSPPCASWAAATTPSCASIPGETTSSPSTAIGWSKSKPPTLDLQRPEPACPEPNILLPKMILPYPDWP